MTCVCIDMLIVFGRALEDPFKIRVYVFVIGGSKETWVGTCRILNKFKLGVGAWVRVRKRGKIFLYI